MKALLGFLTVFPAAVSAEDWTPLGDNAAIRAALADQTLVFDAHTMQHFTAAGSTQYITDRMSEGRWAARSGQYCSTWPPSDVWTCYDIQTLGEQVKFISSDRFESVGTYRKKN